MNTDGSDIEPLVKKALERAKEEHGDWYNSPHEMWAVLREELQEIAEPLNDALDLMKRELWQAIRHNDEDEALFQVEDIRRNLSLALLEVFQAIAVCEKWQEQKKWQP